MAKKSKKWTKARRASFMATIRKRRARRPARTPTPLTPGTPDTLYRVENGKLVEVMLRNVVLTVVD